MGYRDESEGLRSRVAELEVELASANAQIARLAGTARVAGGEVILTFERRGDGLQMTDYDDSVRPRRSF